ncbi:hypothetical protein ICN82_15015, partial [Mangrovicoccus sp. HB182678]|nr:hypothetical protein [Mangrovicoccus algicola]
MTLAYHDRAEFDAALRVSRAAAPAVASLDGLDLVAAPVAGVVAHLMQPGHRAWVATVDAAAIARRRRDTVFADALETADLRLGTGRGLALGARLGLGKGIVTRADAVLEALLIAAAAEGRRVAVLGKAAEGLALGLTRRVPGLRAIGI